MSWFAQLEKEQQLLVKFWIPALVNGLVVWVLLLFLGETPLLRASGLALVIVGVTLAMRRMGSVIAMIGGLSLALSPAFWSQTGGGQGEPATIVIAVGVAIVTMGIVAVVSKRPYIALGLGVIVFVALFWSQIGTPRSLRLTGFVVGWLMYLLIDMLLVTNPRPDEAPMILTDGGLKTLDTPVTARSYHTYGILLLVTVGIINDALLTLLLPSVIISLLLTNTRLPKWYWLAICVVLVMGIRGIWLDYFVEQAHLLRLGDWRLGIRWIEMIRLVISQFTIVGTLLSLLGLVRLARWYPHLGIVSMIGFATYWLFGTIYFGPNETVLLLPMYILVILWLSYAVLALSEWASRSISNQPLIGRYAIIVVYSILPISLFMRILAF